MARDDRQVKIRMPHELAEALQQIAAANNRSVTKEIVHVLERHAEASEVVVRTQIRLPGGLHNQIVEAAKKSGRSLNAEMVALLSKAGEPT